MYPAATDANVVHHAESYRTGFQLGQKVARASDGKLAVLVDSNTCSCGSGKAKSARYDARGIFLTYTCEDCHARKMAGYRPDVLTDPAYWTDEPIDED